ERNVVCLVCSTNHFSERSFFALHLCIQLFNCFFPYINLVTQTSDFKVSCLNRELRFSYFRVYNIHIPLKRLCFHFFTTQNTLLNRNLLKYIRKLFLKPCTPLFFCLSRYHRRHTKTQC